MTEKAAAGASSGSVRILTSMQAWSKEILESDPPGDKPAKDGITTTLRLGKEIYVSSEKTVTHLKIGESKEIQPGEFALMLTEEKVITNEETAGLVSMKFEKKMRGLVNITGFHIDPNNEGYLAFGVYNAGAKTQVVRRGDELFSAIFLALGEPVAKDGGGNHQITHLKSDWISWIHGTPTSLAALQNDIDRLRLQLGIAVAAGAAIFTALVGALLAR